MVTKTGLPEGMERGILWLMKLRTDLLKYATPQETIKEAVANNPRYKAEPLFSQTGTGSLSPASTEQYAKEVERSTARIQKALRLSAKSGSRGVLKKAA